MVRFDKASDFGHGFTLQENHHISYHGKRKFIPKSSLAGDMLFPWRVSFMFEEIVSEEICFSRIN